MAPNRPGTPTTTFRLDPDLKARLMQKTAKRGETMTDVFVRAAEEYVRDEDAEAEG